MKHLRLLDCFSNLIQFDSYAFLHKSDNITMNFLKGTVNQERFRMGDNTSNKLQCTTTVQKKFIAWLSNICCSDTVAMSRKFIKKKKKLDSRVSILLVSTILSFVSSVWVIPILCTHLKLCC